MTKKLEEININGKIRIRKDIYSLLIEEAKDFGIFNKQGKVNSAGQPSASSMIKKIIVEYYEIFDKKEEISFQEKEGELVKISYTIRENEDDFYLTMKKINNASYEKNYNNGEYLRHLIESYFEYPKYKRERIIFKKQYNRLSQAIKENKKVTIINKNGSISTISPYKIIPDQLERFNYVMNQGEDSGARKARIAYIKEVTILEEQTSFTQDSLIIFEQMEKYGVLYRYPTKPKENIRVRITKIGYERYKRSSIHKPIPIEKQYIFYFQEEKEQVQKYFKLEENNIKEENGQTIVHLDAIQKTQFVNLLKKKRNKLIPNNNEYIYTFNCSFDQIREFFIKFGKEAEILEPASLRQSFKKFYQESLELYND